MGMLANALANRGGKGLAIIPTYLARVAWATRRWQEKYGGLTYKNPWQEYGAWEKGRKPPAYAVAISQHVNEWQYLVHEAQHWGPRGIGDGPVQEDLIKDIVEDCQKRNERKERELKKKKPSPSIGGWSGNSGSGFPLGSGRRCTIWVTRTCVDGDSGELGVCDEAEGPDGEPICELDGIEVGGCSYNVHVTCSGGLAMLLEGTGLRLADVVRLADIVGGGPACPASPARQARARPRDGPLASPAPVRRLRGGTKRILAQVEARARS